MLYWGSVGHHREDISWANLEFGQHRYNPPRAQQRSGIQPHQGPAECGVSSHQQPSGQKPGVYLTASDGLSPLGCFALKEGKLRS